MCARYNEAPIEQGFMLHSAQYILHFACGHASISAAPLARSAVKWCENLGAQDSGFATKPYFPLILTSYKRAPGSCTNSIKAISGSATCRHRWRSDVTQPVQPGFVLVKPLLLNKSHKSRT